MYSDAIDHLGILSCRFLGGLSSSRLVARVTTKARFLTGLNIKKHEEDRYDMVIDRSKLSILLGCSAIKLIFCIQAVNRLIVIASLSGNDHAANLRRKSFGTVMQLVINECETSPLLIDKPFEEVSMRTCFLYLTQYNADLA